MPALSFTEELLAKQKQLIGGAYHSGATEVQTRLAEEVKAIALAHKEGGWGWILPPGVKKKSDATVKVNNEYAGDWSAIKDLARCTLVVRYEADLDKAVRAVKAHFQNQKWVVIEEKETIGFLNKAGYSGYTVFLSSRGSSKAEVQVNTPAMLYGKDLGQFAQLEQQKQMGQIGTVSHMRATYNKVQGGLGHKLYETARDKTVPVDKRAKYDHACKLYYNYFRQYPPNFTWGMAAFDAIKALNDPRIIP